MSNIVTRPIDTDAVAQLMADGLSPFMARIYAARGISGIAQLAPDLSRLIPPEWLRKDALGSTDGRGRHGATRCDVGASPCAADSTSADVAPRGARQG